MPWDLLLLLLLLLHSLLLCARLCGCLRPP
jgi:hypothetical protein